MLSVQQLCQSFICGKKIHGLLGIFISTDERDLAIKYALPVKFILVYLHHLVYTRIVKKRFSDFLEFKKTEDKIILS